MITKSAFKFLFVMIALGSGDSSFCMGTKVESVGQLSECKSKSSETTEQTVSTQRTQLRGVGSFVLGFLTELDDSLRFVLSSLCGSQCSSLEDVVTEQDEKRMKLKKHISNLEPTESVLLEAHEEEMGRESVELYNLDNHPF